MNEIATQNLILNHVHKGTIQMMSGTGAVPEVEDFDWVLIEILRSFRPRVAMIDDTDDEAENCEWPMFLYCPWAWRVCSTLSQAADARALGSYLPGMSDGLFGSKEATRISI